MMISVMIRIRSRLERFRRPPEFAGLDLGDGRRNKRAKILMERFAANPTASILDACDSWSETCAAYRFLSNDDVEWRDILAPHWTQTQVRMSAHPVVLCVQDTTELDFNGQDIEGPVNVKVVVARLMQLFDLFPSWLRPAPRRCLFRD